jgi:hypothetical protein
MKTQSNTIVSATPSTRAAIHSRKGIRRKFPARALALAAALALLLPALPAAAENKADSSPVIHTTFNTTQVRNGPSQYPEYRNDEGDVLLTSVTTYHWNDGRGAEPGTIGVYEKSSGKCLGTWQASTRHNKTWWDAFPRILLEKGKTYYFVDSDQATWSYNAGSGNVGFIELCGLSGQTASSTAGMTTSGIAGPTPTPVKTTGIPGATPTPVKTTGRGELTAVPARRGSNGVTLSVDKTRFAPQEPIAVSYVGVPQEMVNHYAWICMAGKDAAAADYKSGWQRPAVGNGSITLAAPYEEGTYELRFYAASSANEENLDRSTIITFTVERPELTKNVTISVPKTVYAPEEAIDIAYTGVTQWLVDHYAWICVSDKDAEAASYKSGWQRPALGNGTLTLAAPFDEGEYEVRFYSEYAANTQNFEPRFTIPFSVRHSELTKDVTLSIPKTLFAPEEAIDVAYTGVTQWLVDHYAWICVSDKGAEAASYKNGWKRPEAGDGSVTLTAPFDEGEYELRFYDGSSANDLNFAKCFTISFTVRHSELTKDVTLSVSKTLFAPEEAIDIDYTGVTDWLVGHYAWICVADRNAPATAYKNGWNRPEAGDGRVTLTAPFDEGEYELRFYDGSSANTLNFVTRLTIPFTVLHSELTKDVALSVPKTLFAPEEAIDIAYTGVTQWLVDHYAWICVADRNAPATAYKNGWNRPALGNGTLTLTAPFDEGGYELRFYDGSSANTLNFVTRLTIPFTVLHSELTKGVTLSVSKTRFAPGEEIAVGYTGVTQWLVNHYAWICVADRNAPATDYKSGWKRPALGSGTVTLTAPSGEGAYELRFFDGYAANDLNFAKCFTIPFTVGPGPATPGVVVSAPPSGSVPPGGVVVSTPPTGSVPPGGVVVSTPPTGSVPPGGVGSTPPAGSVPPGGRDRDRDPVIYTTFNIRQVQNGPSHYPEYRNDEGWVLLTSTTTYHWNNGRGGEPGTISIFEKDTGRCLGTWQETSRNNGTYWDAYLRIVLEKGKTYYFVDSVQETWSYNKTSGNAGFIELCGFVNATGSSAGPGTVPPQPEDMDHLLDEMGATKGEITASIYWPSKDDLDLHCNTPGGSHIYHRNKSAGGGTLDVDMQVEGDRDSGVENIYFAEPEKGFYEFYVDNYKDRTDGDTPCRFRLKVGNQDMVDETVSMGATSRIWKINYLGNGQAKKVEERSEGASP